MARVSELAFLAFLALFAGCVADRPSSEDVGPGPKDAGAEGDSANAPDTGPDAGTEARCDPKKAFDKPINVPNVNTKDYENYVTLTADEKTMYLSSTRNGHNAIFLTTFSMATSTFAIPQLEGTINDDADDRAPSITGDGTRLYLRSNRTGTLGLNDIWTTNRTVAGAAFPKPAQAQNVNGAADDIDPSVQSNGERVFFASNRNNSGGEFEIFESVVTEGTTGAPTLVTALGKGVRWPVISADGLTLYYGSIASHASAKGGADIWASTRTSVQADFPAGAPVSELNDVADDTPGWVSPDHCVMYLLSERANGAGLLDVWVARRPK